jgi:dienelactone hydrolase
MLGNGPDRVWVFTPAGESKSLVIYLHGQGGPVEATPVNHRPWIDHLVAGGTAVVYPRWELVYERAVMAHVVTGVRTAIERLGLDDAPVMAIGYSRGGALAVEYGATAPGEDLPVPDAIVSVFPTGSGEEAQDVDLGGLDDETRLVFFIGQEDDVVGNVGVRILLRRLQQGGFPGERIALRFVRSRGSFTADHFAPMQTSPAARTAFWAPADGMLRAIEQ